MESRRKESISWVGHHDFASDGHIRSLSADNRESLQLKYCTDLDRFRSDACSFLETFGANGDTERIAVFEQDVFRAAQPSSLLRTLIVISKHQDHPGYIEDFGDVRIVSNEKINSSSNNNWLGVDFQATWDYRSQYFMQMFSLDVPQFPSIEMNQQTIGTEKNEPVCPPLFVPIFGVKENSLFISKNYAIPPKIPTVTMTKDDGRKYSVEPLGNSDNLEDCEQALRVGVGLLEQVLGVEPVLVQSNL